ncbi:hypothetical protein FHP91_00875 [Denitromonas halophila]|uniref:Uncharacterized protein n=1 Tax=Denitromonas halophila TaxID=1629404 RepID=A0A557R2C7_9RHOO|nr:hypothetical protein FHP91_00875 [Denitromonas halophila]
MIGSGTGGSGTGGTGWGSPGGTGGGPGCGGAGGGAGGSGPGPCGGRSGSGDKGGSPGLGAAARNGALQAVIGSPPSSHRPDICRARRAGQPPGTLHRHLNFRPVMPAPVPACLHRQMPPRRPNPWPAHRSHRTDGRPTGGHPARRTSRCSTTNSTTPTAFSFSAWIGVPTAARIRRTSAGHQCRCQPADQPQRRGDRHPAQDLLGHRRIPTLAMVMICRATTAHRGTPKRRETPA